MSTRQYILLNPGPVNIRPKVRKSLLLPDLCHRELEFAKLLRETRSNLLKVFGIEKTFTTAIITGSGTSALEAAVSSCVDEDEKILVINNGVYGERISKIADVHGLGKAELKYNFDMRPKAQDVDRELARDESIRVVAIVHHETSTGMLNPLEEIGAIVAKHGRTLLVDAISSLGGEPFNFNKSEAGIVVGTSGKCLHGFPGLAFVLIRKDEAKRIAKIKPHSFYLDLTNSLANQEKDDVPFTPAVPLFYAFNEALKEIQKDGGVAKRIAAYKERSELIHKTLKKLGVKFLLPEGLSSQCLVALYLPEGLTYQKLHDALKQSGFVIYAGQSKFKDKIFRISNLGDYPLSTIKRFCQTLTKIVAGKRKHAAPSMALD
ncbi:MAG: 2-aminoethylphosphonate aminotransferase [Candidatus Omnitrophica bacterium]|nr:2-aminoethylphosphonate aminotransferase [Candidatus Omnitrophota bacterium]